MITTSISSRSFNQDVSQAKRAAEAGPVVITDRGRPAYVLMRHDDYQHLVGPSPTIVELLAQPGMEDIEFDPPSMGPGIFKIPDLT
jgi:antitoxin (DNA-binding transcriptional repressor) of toxin-antitoxin stability system